MQVSPRSITFSEVMDCLPARTFARRRSPLALCAGRSEPAVGGKGRNGNDRRIRSSKLACMTTLSVPRTRGCDS